MLDLNKAPGVGQLRQPPQSAAVHFRFSGHGSLCSADGRLTCVAGPRAAICLLASLPALLRVASVAQLVWPELPVDERLAAYRRCVRGLEDAVGIRLFMPGVLHGFFAYVSHEVVLEELQPGLFEAGSAALASMPEPDAVTLSAQMMSVIERLMSRAGRDGPSFS